MLAEKFGRPNPAVFLEEISPGLRMYWLAYLKIKAEAASGKQADEELTPEEALAMFQGMPGVRVDGG